MFSLSECGDYFDVLSTRLYGFVRACVSARPHSGATALPEENSEENWELYVSAISIPNENTKSETFLQNRQLRYENLQKSAPTCKLQRYSYIS